MDLPLENLEVVFHRGLRIFFLFSLMLVTRWIKLTYHGTVLKILHLCPSHHPHLPVLLKRLYGVAPWQSVSETPLAKSCIAKSPMRDEANEQRCHMCWYHPALSFNPNFWACKLCWNDSVFFIVLMTKLPSTWTVGTVARRFWVFLILNCWIAEELDMMLQGRSGSGDGGELIDRVSLTSSISFIQSQTFPESIFSQSFSRYSIVMYTVGVW